MADKPHEDELAVDKTEGFKLGEKKTIDEYQQLGMIQQLSLSLSVSLSLSLSLFRISWPYLQQNLCR